MHNSRVMRCGENMVVDSITTSENTVKLREEMSNRKEKERLQHNLHTNDSHCFHYTQATKSISSSTCASLYLIICITLCKNINNEQVLCLFMQSTNHVTGTEYILYSTADICQECQLTCQSTEFIYYLLSKLMLVTAKLV